MSDLIEAHLASMRAAGAAKTTVIGREGVLRRAHRSDELVLGLDYATEEEVSAYLGGHGWQPRTVAVYHQHLSAYYIWAVARGHLDFSPMELMTQPRAPRRHPRPVSNAQLAQVLAGTTGVVRLCAILAAYQGLRCCEIATLHREDVAEDTLYVRLAKGGGDDELDVSPVVWRAVKDLGPGPVIVSAGAPVYADAHWVSRTTTRRIKKLGLPGVGMHRLRHWHATTLRRGGADTFVVQQAMRHRSLTSTQGYTQIGGGERLAAVLTLPDLTVAA